MGDLGSIPELGRSPGERDGNPLQYSGLENYMDRGAWQVTVHGVTKSWTWLSYVDFTSLRLSWFHFTAPLLLQSTGSRCMGFNNYSTWVLQFQLAGFRAWAQQIWCTGLGAPWHVESSQTRDQTCVLCISKQIPIHWATREVSVVFLNSASSNAQHRTCHKTDA